MNICVFCSAHDAGGTYTNAGRELARLVGTQGHSLVWGGSNVGTMKEIADAAEAAGATLIGVSVEAYRHNARPGVADMTVAPNLGARKEMMLRRADALVALPGGFGTLDEITEVLELKKQDAHAKPVVFLNIDGFYDGMRMQLERMDREGFLPKRLTEYLFFAETAEEAMRYIEKHGSN
jgi:uncharacterized protein (TIGR00730 family)